MSVGTVASTAGISAGAEPTDGVLITAVEAGSLGEYLGMAAGDKLLRLNDRTIEDVLDYWYYSTAARLRVEWWSHSRHSILQRTIRKATHERLGIELEPFEIKRCNNACVFCFVHQLPRGLRRELYVKDEDYRLSFLYGNYITGTSLTPADIDRIVRLKLSPLYFSVHATDENVRRQLLVNPLSPPIMPLLAQLTSNGISIHTQIVLCPGLNDGNVLIQTVQDLSTLYPGILSVAVVPVGLTSHRQRLPTLKEVTPEYARAFVKFCERLQRRMKTQLGFPFVFPSDEFYLIASMKPPSYAAYEEIPQLENGVGMMSLFYRDFDQYRASLPRRLPKKHRVLAITSRLGAKVIEPLVRTLNQSVENLEVAIDVRTNSLFGPGITVTGLLPGADFLTAIRAHPDFDRYLVPDNALRPWDKRFLDDMTLEELQQVSQHRVYTGSSSATSFVEAALAGLV